MIINYPSGWTIILLAAAGGLCVASPLHAVEYKASVATAVITPTEPTWIGGYAARTEPGITKVHDLHAKVLLIQDSHGYTIAWITLDTENVPRVFADHIAAELHKKSGLTREQVVIACSHTHCGPALDSADAQIIYPMTPEQYAMTKKYTNWLQDKVISIVAEAHDQLVPAELSFAVGECGFGVNRRNNEEAATTQPGFVPVGPVDHDVPVLRVKMGDKQAVLFGYACHCTTLNFQHWCGDWAGFAKIDVEAKHPGTTAMFMVGCGGDINPLPRRKLELCQKYGRQLADSVEKVLAEPMRSVHGSLRATYKIVDLPFESVPSREQLQATAATSKLDVEKRCISYLLAQLDAGRSWPTHYPYPVQVLRIGKDLTAVVLAGETVVDYSLRLKRELGSDRTFVFSYANDVCAYMPSERVLKEGRYEGRDAMLFYGHPSAWAPGLEAKIVGAIHEMTAKVRGAATTAPAR